jgi:uncharacterized protein
MAMNEDVVAELTTDECWQLLGSQQLGRLAYRLVDEVHITPINYALMGDSLVFNTAEGNKLLAVVMGSEVAFEIDTVEDDSARSVIVRGTARLLPEDEVGRAEASGLRPWVPTLKYNYVEIVPTSVTGRVFTLARA